MLAVLNPAKLERQAAELESLYYTSYMKFKYGNEDSDPTVNGIAVNNNRCLRFWTEKSRPVDPVRRPASARPARSAARAAPRTTRPAAKHAPKPAAGRGKR